MRPLFLLRPEPDASRSAARASAMGLEPVVAPLFTVTATAWAVPHPTDFDGLLLTSANAVRHGGPGLGSLRNLPVHAVGESSAAAARKAGFTVVTVGNAGVDGLLAAIEGKPRLLHLCGADRRSAALPAAIVAIPVYRARPLSRPLALDAIGGAVAALHSPRAARRLAGLVEPETKRKVRIAAISAEAAAAAGAGWEAVEAAAVPSDAALLALAARLCDKPDY